MQNLNSQAQLIFLKDAFGTMSDKTIDMGISIVGVHAHKDLERGNPKRINTWLYGSFSYMKNAESMIEVLLENKPLSHFLLFYKFEFSMEMDKDTLKSLASTLGVTMQQPNMI